MQTIVVTGTPGGMYLVFEADGKRHTVRIEGENVVPMIQAMIQARQESDVRTVENGAIKVPA